MTTVSLFYDYVDVNGVNIVKAWLDQLGPKVKAKVNTRLNTLEQMNRTDWAMPMTEVLTGDKDGLIAIRVGYQGIAYRLLGYDGPNRAEFTLLAYCTERDDKYIPLDIGRKAFDRRKATEANPNARRTRHDFG
jgi:hypothetical protein